MDEITNFPEGVSSFGVPQVGAGRIPVTNGKYFFVDGTNGNDGNSGNSMVSSFKTITGAVNVASTGDVVLIMPGTYTGVVTIADAGVRLIGLGSATKSVVMTSTTDVTTLAITAANVEVAGIYFKPPVNTSPSTTFFASITLSNASYANIHDCRFQGQTNSVVAIYSSTENSDNCTIANNTFAYMNTATYGAGIIGVAAGGLDYSLWKIINNIFQSCVKAIVLPARVCLLQGNHIGSAGITSAGAEGAVTTTGINLSGTNSGANMVHGNFLGGTYSAVGGYTVGTAGDDWSGNFNIAGLTAANPS